MDRTRELGESPIGPILARFALPTIIGMVVSALYNVVDRIFIGRGVGELALAAVTVSFPFQLAQIAFSILIGVGASSLISINLGEQDKNKAERILGNGFCLSMIISVATAIIGIAFLDPLLRIFGASETVLPYARSFTFVVLLGTPLGTISMGLNGFIRSEGNPKVAMATQLVGPLLNIVLCPVFIFVLKLGVVGSALANVISQTVGSALVLGYYFSGKSLLKIRLANLVPKLDLALSIMALGSATALSEFASAIMNGIMNNQLERYGGDSSVTAMGIVFAIGNLVYMVFLGMNMGTQPLIGYNIGAGHFGRVRKIVLTAIASASIFAVAVFLIVQLVPGTLVSLFAGSSSNVREIGIYAIRHYFLFLPLLGAQVLGAGYFQAAGKPTKSLVLGLSRQFIILVPLLFILPLFWGLNGVWNAQPVADILSFALTIVFLVREIRFLGSQKKPSSALR
jgi:putative MATE family efflux protein